MDGYNLVNPSCYNILFSAIKGSVLKIENWLTFFVKLIFHLNLFKINLEISNFSF